MNTLQTLHLWVFLHPKTDILTKRMDTTPARLARSGTMVGDSDTDDASTHVSELKSQTVILPDNGTCCFFFSRKHCCCCSRRRVGRNTALRKKLEPNINDPEVYLERWQRKFLLNQTVTTLEDYEYKHTSNKRWYEFLGRMLKFLTVLLPALVVAEKTPYVQNNDTAVMVMFFVMMLLTLQVNYLSSVLTDFAYMKRMVLFSEAKTSLEIMLNNFLTRTQRYGGFKKQSDAFRTFKRDEGALRIMVMQKDNFLHTGSQEQMEQSSNVVVAKRREFSSLFDPIDEEEEHAMFEKRSKLVGKARARRHRNASFRYHMSHAASQRGERGPRGARVSHHSPDHGDPAANAAQVVVEVDTDDIPATAPPSGLRRRVTPPKDAPVPVPVMTTDSAILM